MMFIVCEDCFPKLKFNLQISGPEIDTKPVVFCKIVHTARYFDLISFREIFVIETFCTLFTKKISPDLRSCMEILERNRRWNTNLGLWKFPKKMEFNLTSKKKRISDGGRYKLFFLLCLQLLLQVVTIHGPGPPSLPEFIESW